MSKHRGKKGLGIAALSIIGGVFGGGVIFMTGVGVGMYPTEVNGKLPQASNAAAPAGLMPQATTTITAPQLPRATITITKNLPGATKTIKLPSATKTRYLPQATKTIIQKVPQATKVAPKKVAPSKRPPLEDEAGFDCRTQGNRVCGPDGSQFPAGCYRGGVRVIAWSNYSNPRLDPLWGQVKSPC